MDSRAEHREQRRADRLARDRAATAGASARRRRLLGGGLLAVLVLAGVIVAVVVIANVSSPARRSHGTRAAAASTPAPGSTAAARHRVSALLAGIPEAPDDLLGRTTAPITIIEYGDLECAVCDAFALGTNARVSDGTRGTGIENAIIDTLVKTGRAKLVYDALETATADGATPDEFVPQQAAVYAAGLQDRAWYYLELFYNEQRPEGSDYVDQSFLNGIALQVPGLNYAKWLQDSRSAKLRAQVLADNTRGTEVDGGAPGTPTVVVQSPRDGVIAAQGIPTLAQVEQAIRAVQ